MITDLFLYFARFPKRSGVKAMFTMGGSDFSEYATLLDTLDGMDGDPIVPDIENYVYGQSVEDLQQRVSKLFGSWMMVDYGEFTIKADRRGAVEAVQQVAVTVAMKMRQNADMMERVIASDRTLDMVRRVLQQLWADSDSGDIAWLTRGSLEQAEIVPFVASELSSYGWTLMFSTAAAGQIGTGDIKPAKVKPW